VNGVAEVERVVAGDSFLEEERFQCRAFDFFRGVEGPAWPQGPIDADIEELELRV
jgi:hypothetical protein